VGGRSSKDEGRASSYAAHAHHLAYYIVGSARLKLCVDIAREHIFVLEMRLMGMNQIRVDGTGRVVLTATKKSGTVSVPDSWLFINDDVRRLAPPSDLHDELRMNLHPYAAAPRSG
jgi:hypothetical protein